MVLLPRSESDVQGLSDSQLESLMLECERSIAQGRAGMREYEVYILTRMETARRDESRVPPRA
jgi:hypothetical protein